MSDVDVTVMYEFPQGSITFFLFNVSGDNSKISCIVRLNRVPSEMCHHINIAPRTTATTAENVARHFIYFDPTLDVRPPARLKRC